MEWKFLLLRKRKTGKRNIRGVSGWKEKKSYRTVAAAALAINFSKIRNWFCADSSESFRKQVGSERDIHKCTLEQKEKKILSEEVAA